MNCEYIRDVYPDVLNDRLDPAVAQQVRAHIAACDECREETALVAALHDADTPLPAGLHERVVRAVRAPQPRRRVSRSGLAMAATLAATVIGGSLFVRSQSTSTQKPEEGFGFVSVQDAMLSGTASLNDLSVEELEKLLGEMES